jgi:hypothetical protein
MGRRKTSKTGNSAPEAKRSNMQAFAIVGLMVVFLAALYFYTRPATESRAHVDPASALVEVRPVLSPDMFTGKAALAYKYAAEISKVIDSQFCYCYCKKDHGHKTLLTCFTNKHGAKCDVCIDEVLYAYELHKEGKSIDDIIVAIDKRFFRPYQPHRI